MLPEEGQALLLQYSEGLQGFAAWIGGRHDGLPTGMANAGWRAAGFESTTSADFPLSG
ncbi:MAG: hypothetical protein GX493_02575 [Firmicutes bacterium]|nr:hypothetical protein [Bacillota bacterium]